MITHGDSVEEDSIQPDALLFAQLIYNIYLEKKSQEKIENIN